MSEIQYNDAVRKIKLAINELIDFSYEHNDDSGEMEWVQIPYSLQAIVNICDGEVMPDDVIMVNDISVYMVGDGEGKRRLWQALEFDELDDEWQNKVKN